MVWRTDVWGDQVWVADARGDTGGEKMELTLVVFLLTDVDVSKIFGALVQEGFGVKKTSNLLVEKNLLGAMLPLEITSLPSSVRAGVATRAKQAVKLIRAALATHKIPYLGLALSEQDDDFEWSLGSHSALCKDHDDCKGEESLSRACVTRDVMAKAAVRKIPRKTPAKKPVKRAAKR